MSTTVNRQVMHPAWRHHDRTNPLIADGSHERIFAAEVIPGDVNAFGEEVASVHRHGDTLVIITYTNGFVERARPAATRLMRSRA